VAALGAWQQEGNPSRPATGLPPANWYPDPQDPARVRYWDGTAWTAHSQPAAPSYRVEPTQASPQPSLRGPAQVLKVFLWIYLALTVVAILSDLAELSLLGQIADDPSSVDPNQVTASDIRQVLIGATQFLVYLATAITFLVWFRRAYLDRSLDRGRLRFSSGWTIGSWFVPFLNLVRPKQIMDDVWRASEPGQAAYPHDRRPPVPGLLHAWWALWVISLLLGSVVLSFSRDTDTIEGLRQASTTILIADIVEVPLTILALLVVTRLTQRILARGDYAARQPG
jgi:Domain of unknown function (DUF4328)/Protein of unknown function (DUF2510)